MSVYFAIKGTRLVLQDSSGYDPWVPILPQLTVDTTLPTGWDGTADATPADSAAITTALTNVDQNAGHPWIIQLTAGATYAGTFTIPAKTGPYEIIIRTSAYASLPSVGTRVTPSDVANLAKIQSTGATSAILFEFGAQRVRFLGIEITTDHAVRTSTLTNLIVVGRHHVTDAAPTALSELPQYITFERCYVHGTTTGNVRRGFYLDGRSVAVIDSYLDDFHEVGADSQGIFGLQPQGVKITNNYIAAAGENVMFGGADPSIADALPTDITFTRNHCKKPLLWKTDDPSYDGYNWSVKNLFELKNSLRVLVEGNVFENSWVASQAGFGILITPRQAGEADWSQVNDVTIRNNKILNVQSFIQILSSNDGGVGFETGDIERLSITNNSAFIDTEGFDVGSGRGPSIALSGVDGHPVQYFTFAHNTVVAKDDNTLNMVGAANEIFATNARWRNNILPVGYYAFAAVGVTVGEPSIIATLANYQFDYNVITYYPTVTVPSDYTFPAGNFEINGNADVGFTDLNGGDYSLGGGSSYNNAASDGTDIGCDISALNTAIAGVE